MEDPAAVISSIAEGNKMDAETVKNVELIRDMKDKLQQMYMKQNEVGLQKTSDKSSFFASPTPKGNPMGSPSWMDLRSPSLERFANSNHEADESSISNQASFFPF